MMKLVRKFEDSAMERTKRIEGPKRSGAKGMLKYETRTEEGGDMVE